MLSDEMTTGGMQSRDSDKRAFAAQSHAWNIKQKKFKEAFPEVSGVASLLYPSCIVLKCTQYCTPAVRDVPNMGERDRGKSEDRFGKANSDHTAPALSSIPNTNNTTLPRGQQHQQVQPGGTADPIASAADMPTRASGSGWSSLSSWVHAVSGHWRWGLFLAVAVVVSRLSSSR
jgi:ubiquitin-conjugating enzyme E2 J2